jgi:hypothetical protein
MCPLSRPTARPNWDSNPISRQLFLSTSFYGFPLLIAILHDPPTPHPPKCAITFTRVRKLGILWPIAWLIASWKNWIFGSFGMQCSGGWWIVTDVSRDRFSAAWPSTWRQDVSSKRHVVFAQRQCHIAENLDHQQYRYDNLKWGNRVYWFYRNSLHPQKLRNNSICPVRYSCII